MMKVKTNKKNNNEKQRENILHYHAKPCGSSRYAKLKEENETLFRRSDSDKGYTTILLLINLTEI
jgi:hypothetical protein